MKATGTIFDTEEGVSIFHKPVKRTFHRMAKAGIAVADGRRWAVAQQGMPYNGYVVLTINVAKPEAAIECNRCDRRPGQRHCDKCKLSITEATDLP